MNGHALRQERGKSIKALKYIAVAAFIGTVVLANALTGSLGMIGVGFGLTATAGTFAAGLAFVARDAVDDTAGRAWVLGAVAVGAALSALVAPPALAIASAVAFLVSELVDWGVYRPLRKRGYVRAAVASNIIGSIVDTVLFLSVAGFGLGWLPVLGQLVGKGWVTLVTVGVVVSARALFRDRIRSART